MIGDGVAVPVVRWLAEHLLEPLLAPNSAVRANGVAGGLNSGALGARLRRERLVYR